MTAVFIESTTYEEKRLQPVVDSLLESTLGAQLQPGMRVLLKPNLLRPAGPESAVMTHPMVVRAVAAYALAKGARVTIGDSQAVGSWPRVLKTGGYLEALKEMPVALQEFKKAVSVDIGPPFGAIMLAREAVEADLVVNLAKLKTHSMMLLTLGIKNLFGCVLGMEKPQWHLRIGQDHEMFAQLLVQIHYAINPAVTLIDGILAMEGHGPGRSGTPRSLGMLVASRDAATADAAVCRLLNLDPHQLPTHRAAYRLERIQSQPHIAGTFQPISDFELVPPGPAQVGPPFVHRFARRHILRKPMLKSDGCRQCGACVHYCPTGAVAETGTSVCFQLDRCIRCYCCVEVCPHGVLQTHTPLLGRVLASLGLL